MNYRNQRFLQHLLNLSRNIQHMKNIIIYKQQKAIEREAIVKHAGIMDKIFQALGARFKVLNCLRNFINAGIMSSK
jgi:hypothetical protein